jgi:hypothetical protein
MDYVYVTKGCEARLVGCTTESSSHSKYSPNDENFPGFVGHQFVIRTSQDGTCIVQSDIYTFADGHEEIKHYIIDVDGQEYYPVDYPINVGDEL